ncbi:Hypothetical predicted protein, partial [Paramuricea clavata]
MNVVQLALVNNVETSKPLQKTPAPNHRNNNQFCDELHRAVHKRLTQRNLPLSGSRPSYATATSPTPQLSSETHRSLSLQQKGFGKNQMSESDYKAAQSKANKQRSQQINQEQKHKKNKNKKQKVKNNEQKAKENEQTREAHKASEEITAERQRTKKTVVIAGDSIIKYVK